MNTKIISAIAFALVTSGLSFAENWVGTPETIDVDTTISAGEIQVYNGTPTSTNMAVKFGGNKYSTLTVGGILSINQGGICIYPGSTLIVERGGSVRLGSNGSVMGQYKIADTGIMLKGNMILNQKNAIYAVNDRSEKVGDAVLQLDFQGGNANAAKPVITFNADQQMKLLYAHSGGYYATEPGATFIFGRPYNEKVTLTFSEVKSTNGNGGSSNPLNRTTTLQDFVDNGTIVFKDFADFTFSETTFNDEDKLLSLGTWNLSLKLTDKDGISINDDTLVWNWDAIDGGYALSVSSASVPEPAEWAAIFGAIAIGLAIYRRRK